MDISKGKEKKYIYQVFIEKFLRIPLNKVGGGMIVDFIYHVIMLPLLEGCRYRYLTWLAQSAVNSQRY